MLDIRIKCQQKKHLFLLPKKAIAHFFQAEVLYEEVIRKNDSVPTLQVPNLFFRLGAESFF
jgi:hypothetical protein